MVSGSKLRLYKIGGVRNTRANMPKLNKNQAGFIPMIIGLIALIVLAIVFVYLRVLKAN